nr:hypothetical protein [Tanacetum cinerariifolium]
MKETKNTLRALRLIVKKRKVRNYSRYPKAELARLLDEGCRRHDPVTDDMIPYTARERNVPRYTMYPKSELFEILGLNIVAGMKEKKNTLCALLLIAKKRKVRNYSRYPKAELARLLDEGCRRHDPVTDDMIPYTTRELRAIASERNVPRYTIYPKSELFEILGLNIVAWKLQTVTK